MPNPAVEHTLRAETSGDIGGIRGVHLAAFPTAYEADLVDSLRKSAAAWTGLSFVTVVDGHVVAHVLLTKCGIVPAREGSRDGKDATGGNQDGETEVQPALCLAPVAVLPAFQRSGHGTRLVKHALAQASSTSPALPVVVLGHPEYYPRFGFRPARHHRIHAPFKLGDPDALMILNAGDVQPGVVRYASEFGL